MRLYYQFLILSNSRLPHLSLTHLWHSWKQVSLTLCILKIVKRTKQLALRLISSIRAIMKVQRLPRKRANMRPSCHLRAIRGWQFSRELITSNKVGQNIPKSDMTMFTWGGGRRKEKKVYSEMLEAGSFIIINCSGKCIFTATFRLVFN